MWLYAATFRATMTFACLFNKQDIAKLARPKTGKYIEEEGRV